MYKLLATIENINKDLHYDTLNIPDRQKCFSLLTWSFGWGMYTNAKENIKNIV